MKLGDVVVIGRSINVPEGSLGVVRSDGILSRDFVRVQTIHYHPDRLAPVAPSAWSYVFRLHEIAFNLGPL